MKKELIETENYRLNEDEEAIKFSIDSHREHTLAHTELLTNYQIKPSKWEKIKSFFTGKKVKSREEIEQKIVDHISEHITLMSTENY